MRGDSRRAAAEPSPQLQICLLGVSRVAVDGREVDEPLWLRRHAKLLVKMLALEPSRRLHREVVMARFWPDLAPARASNNLHKAVHAARRALEPDLGGRARSRFLRVEGQYVILDNVASVDVDAFRLAAESAERTRDPADVDAALALYSGDLLADELYDDWASEPRERCAVVRRRLLLLAADLHESHGDVERCAATVRDLLAESPFDERWHRRLMSLYAASGQRGRAIQQFLTCRERLALELQAEPEPATVKLYEAIAAGRLGPAVDRPARRARTDNLPTRATRFLGREHEIPAVANRLGDERLVTLAGPGGIGKTRLALEVARAVAGDYPDGVWLVELAPVADGALVAHAVARALETADDGRDDTGDALLARLASKQLLLVLDNCEHLVDDCAAFVARLLKAAARVTVLATSREALGVDGETVWPVPPLVVPPPVEGEDAARALESDAVRLFVDRARLQSPDFAVDRANAAEVSAICRQLDGLPLAIELAARRVGLLSPAQILERLRDRFALLQGPPRAGERRHSSLKATLDWSYDSLTERERTLLRRLTIFPGSFEIAAAERIASGGDVAAEEVLELLGRLVDKSLLAVERPAAGTPSDARYVMLHTIREYGREKLRETGEEARLGEAMLDYYARLAESAAAEFPGPNERAAVRRIALEADNLRAAMAVAATAEHGGESALRLCGGLVHFWSLYGSLRESRAHVEAILARGGPADALRGRALYGFAFLLRRQGDILAAMAAFEQSADACRAADDRRGVARALTSLAALLHRTGELSRSHELLDEAESIYTALGARFDRSRVLFARGLLAIQMGDYELAREQFEISLSLSREIGALGGRMVALHNLGEVEFRLGAPERAEAHLHESLRLSEELDDRHVSADSHCLLAEIAATAGRMAEGAEHARLSIERYAAEGDESGVAEAARWLAVCEAGPAAHAAGPPGANRATRGRNRSRSGSGARTRSR